MQPPTKACSRIPIWGKVIIVVAVVLVVLATVIGIILGAVVPNIVQQRVGASTLAFNSMYVSEPTESSFHLEGAGTVDNAGKDDSQIQENTLTVSYKGQVMGRMPLKKIDVNGGEPTPIQLESDFTIDNADVFDMFGDDLVNQNVSSWHLSGRPTVKALGLTFKNIKFEKDIDLIGFNGFQQRPVNITSVSVVGGESGKLFLKMEIEIYNPSSLEMEMGETTFDLYFLNTNIGYTTFNLTLRYGLNKFNISGVYVQPGPYNGPTGETGRTFLSRHLGGLTNQISMTGSPNHKNVLQKSLGFLNAQSEVPGMNSPLILKSGISIGLFKLVTTVEMANPFDTSFDLECVNFDVYQNTTLALVGRIKSFCFSTPITVAPRSITTTSSIDLSDVTSLIVPDAVNVAGWFLVSIPRVGGFRQQIDYSARNIKSCLFC